MGGLIWRDTWHFLGWLGTLKSMVWKESISFTFMDIVIMALYGRYYITKRTRQIAANLAIYSAFLVVKIVSIGHFWSPIIISSHSILIKSEKIEFDSTICKKSKNLPYEYVDSILLITQKPGHFSASPLGYTLNISKCKK